jgi:Fibronectin type III domain
MTEPQLDAQGEAREALSSAVADFGQRVLSDPRMIRSRMSDLLPDLPRERDLFVTAAEADVAGELTQHVQEQRLDPDTAVQLVSRSLTDRKSIDPASSTWVTTEYAQALGYRVRPEAPLAPPAPSQSGPPPQPTVTYAPYGAPNLQTAPPPPTPAAGPGGYPGYPPPQAPAGGGAYTTPMPPPGGGYAPTQGPGAGQAPAGVPPQATPPWVPPTSPPKQPNRWRNRWPILAVAAVVVVGLIAGLFVWAPWHKVPVAPTAVHAQSPTATSVLVSWSPSSGGATINQYLILRDGTQVGSVPASQTSYVDNGLAPGTRHQYTIIAVSGTQRSQPSKSVPVTTITPSPVGLAVGQATWTSVQFHWSPPPNSPAPSGYAIVVNGAPGVTLPGGTTSYNDTGLQIATTYQYQVVAIWGSQQSSRSRVLAVTTLAAPLQGSAPLQVKTLSVPAGSTGVSVGETWSDSWTFTPTCTATGCTLKTNGEWAPPNLKAAPFTVTLTGSGAWYVGSATAYITTCGSVNVKNTVSLRITPDNGAVNQGAWSSWHGTWVVSSPYTTESNGDYCPTQSWTLSLNGTY